MPKRSMPLFADGDLQSAELLAVRDMSSGKLRVLKPVPQRAERPAAAPGPRPAHRRGKQEAALRLRLEANGWISTAY